MRKKYPKVAKHLCSRSIHYGLGHHTWFNWRVMPYGAQRRQAILNYLRANRDDPSKNYIAVNKKHCIILREDPDFRRLIKQGKLWMDKIQWCGPRCTMSVLRLPK